MHAAVHKLLHHAKRVREDPTSPTSEAICSSANFTEFVQSREKTSQTVHKGALATPVILSSSYIQSKSSKSDPADGSNRIMTE